MAKKLIRELKIDASQFFKTIKETEAEIQKFAKDDIRSTISVDADTGQAESRINSLGGESQASIEVNADTGKAESKIKGAASEADKLSDKQTINVDTAAAENKIGGLADTLKGSFEGFDLGSVLNFGGGFALAEVATAGLGAIAGGFNDAFNAGNDFNNALLDIQAKTGATTEELDKLREASLTAFRDGVGESVAEATEVIGNLQQRLGSAFTSDEIGKFAGQAQALAKTLDLDVNEVIGKSEPLIKQFGLSGQEAFEVIALAAQNGTSAQDDILDSLSEYSQLAKEAGFSALEFGDALTRGSEAGLFNTDKIADSLKEAQIRINAGDFNNAFKEIVDGSGSVNDVLAQNTQAILNQAQAGEISIKEALTLTSQGISEALAAGDITEAFASNLQVAVAGTPAEDLGVDIYNRIFSAPFDEATIQANAQAAGESIAGAIGQYTSFDEIARNAEAFIADIGQEFVLFADTYIAPIVGSAIEFFEGIGERISGVFNGIDTGGLNDLLSGIGSTIQFIADLVENTLGNALSFAFSLIRDIFEGIGEILSPITDAINEVIEAFNTGGDELGSFGEIATTLFDILSELAGILIDVVVFAISNVTTAIGEVIKFFFDFGDSADKAGDSTSVLTSIVEGLRNVLEGVKNTANGVKSAFTGITDAIGEIVSAILDGNILAAFDLFLDIPKDIGKNFKDGFKEAENAVKNSVDSQSKAFLLLKGNVTDLDNTISSLNKQELKDQSFALTADIKGFEDQANALREAGEITKDEYIVLSRELKKLADELPEGATAEIPAPTVDDKKTEKAKKDIKDSYSEFLKTAQDGLDNLSGIGADFDNEVLRRAIQEEADKNKDAIDSLFASLEPDEAVTGSLIGRFEKAFNDIEAARLGLLESNKQLLEQETQNEIAAINERFSQIETKQKEAALKQLENDKELLEKGQINRAEFDKRELERLDILNDTRLKAEAEKNKQILDLQSNTAKERNQLEKTSADQSIKNFDRVLKAQDQQFADLSEKYQQTQADIAGFLSEYSVDDIIKQNEELQDSFDDVNSSLEEANKENENLLLAGEQSYNEYVDNVIEAEKRKNDELSKLRGDDEQSISSYIANISAISSSVLGATTNLIPEFEKYFTTIDELREKDAQSQANLLEKQKEYDDLLVEAKNATGEKRIEIETKVIEAEKELNLAKKEAEEADVALKEKTTEAKAGFAEEEVAIIGATSTALKSVLDENTAAYKAAAITEASIATYLAASQTLADKTLPFALKAFSAAAIIAAGLANVTKIAGFRDGGFTGEGGANDVAGIVHKREFVSTKETTDKHRPLLEALHSGEDPFDFLLKDKNNFAELEGILSKNNIDFSVPKVRNSEPKNREVTVKNYNNVEIGVKDMKVRGRDIDISLRRERRRKVSRL